MDQPRFPIIQIFEGDNVVYGCTTEHDYVRCDVTFIDKYTNAMVIDSNGRLFQIDSATQTGWGTWLFGYNPLMKGRLAKVALSYKFVKELTWTDFASLLTEQLNKKVDPKWFPNSKSKILKQLGRSNSFQEVIEMFSYERD